MNKLSILALALVLALSAPLALADSAPVEATEVNAEAAAAPAETAEETATDLPEETAAPEAAAAVETPEAAEATEAAEPAATEAPALTPETVLATVNGVEIPYSAVKKYYDAIVAQYGSMFDVTDPSISGSLKGMAVNYAVTEQVMLQKAHELKVDQLTDEEQAALKAKADEAYQATYDQIATQFASQGADEEQSKTAAAAYLESYGYTAESLQEQYMNSDLFERVLSTVTGDLDIEETELKALFDEKVAAAKEAYAANLAQYDTDARSGGTVYFVPEGIRAVKHILVKMDGAEATELKNKIAELDALPADDPGRAELEEAIEGLKAPIQAKLDEIQAKIDAGEDFNALIDEYGEDPGMQEGSPYRDDGYTLSEATTMYDPPFQAAAMALEKPGDVSAPTLGAYGYHFIRYDHDVESKEADFEAEKAAMKETELAAKKAELQNEAIEGWTGEAKIETFLDRFTA